MGSNHIADIMHEGHQDTRGLYVSLRLISLLTSMQIEHWRNCHKNILFTILRIDVKILPFDGIIGEKSRDHKYARFSDNKGTQRLIGHRWKVQGRPQICIYLIHRTPIGSQSQTHRGLCNIMNIGPRAPPSPPVHCERKGMGLGWEGGREVALLLRSVVISL